jgi:hypothetical protein
MDTTGHHFWLKKVRPKNKKKKFEKKKSYSEKGKKVVSSGVQCPFK